MKRLFNEIISENTPKVNSVIVEGLAYKQSQNFESHIDQVFKIVSRKFPDGLAYSHYERCTPEEEWNELSKLRGGKKFVDLARSDIYLVKFFFTYKGESLTPRYMYLPFVGIAGENYNSGSRNFISPVLNDKVISPENKNLFARLSRDKILFDKVIHSMVINERRVSTSVVFSRIYRQSATNKSKDNQIQAKTTLAHYLFAKFGFHQVFDKYVGARVIVGEEEINYSSYSKNEWNIYQSSGIKPFTYKSKYYTPSTIKIAVPKSLVNQFVEDLIAGFFYIVDHFPQQLTANYINAEDEHLTKYPWIITLGRIIFDPKFSDGKIYESLMEHFSSIDEYIDVIIQHKLREEGRDVDDFYDFMVLIIKEFKDLIIRGYEKNNSLYDKELTTIYYVLYPITEQIFKLAFALAKDAKNKTLSAQDITKTMNQKLRMRAIQKNHHYPKIFQTAVYSGDNMFFKFTSMMIPQSDVAISDGKDNDRVNLNDPMKRFHVSFAEAGGYLNLPKSNPSGYARVNPYTKLSPTGTILKHDDEEIRKIIENTQNKLNIDLG